MRGPRVSIVKCEKYEKSGLKQSLIEALQLIGGVKNLLNHGDTVLLKVNLLSPRPPERAVTTHPLFVECLVEIFKAAGAGRVLVGDSSGGAIAGKAVTGKAFKVSGIQEAAEKSGAEVVNFDKTGAQEIQLENGEKLYIAKPLREADLIVTVPKLKTHSMTLFTGAVKNMYGCIPGLKKAEYHRLYPKPEKFAKILADIYHVSKVGLAVMDGITAMEGNGPGSGKPKDLGLILASRDSVALDSVACKIIGYDPFKIDYLKECSLRGLGVAELSKIQIKGVDIREAETRDFQLPSNAFVSIIPEFVASGILNALKAVPEPHPDKCNRCGVCLESCPPKAITMGQLPEIDYTKCIDCLCCHELCPQNAMELRFKNIIGKILSNLIHRKRREKP